MLAGAIYRTEFAAQLREIGLTIIKDNDSFRIEDVPEEFCRAFSQRRHQIEQVLEKTGQYGAVASAKAALLTRTAKVAESSDELFAKWQAVGQQYGFTQKQAASLIDTRRMRRNPEPEKALQLAIQKVTESQSHFSRRELICALAQEAPAYDLDANEVCKAAEEFLYSDRAVFLAQVGDELRFTTTEILDVETQMLACARRLQAGSAWRASEETVQAVIAQRPRLSYDQQNALRHLVRKPGAIHIMSGIAGSGKTSTTEAVRLCYEREGYTVIGAALSAKAARGLQEGAGIPSQTLHRTLFDLKRAGETAGNNPCICLTSRTVLIVDESSMIGTRQMAQLLAEVERAGAQLVLVGDDRQLQSIDAGGGFAALASVVGQAELTEIVRQREAWAREAVACLANGDAQMALSAYAERGLLHIAENRRDAMHALIADWQRDACRPQRHLILASSNQEVDQLNQLAQEARKNLGLLGDRSIAFGDTIVHSGDRVVFVRNDRLRAVQNGALGTIVNVDPTAGTVTVLIDGGSIISFDSHYAYARLGYALTTHWAQGVTTEHASVLFGGPMADREMVYVQLSRGRGETRLYANREEAGENLAILIRQIETSHRKELALDVLARQRPALSLAL